MKRMLLVLSTKLVLAILLVSATFGQKYDPIQDAPDLIITKISWRGGSSGSGPAAKGAFSVEVKNTGAKTIKAVNWDYYFLDTIRGNRIVEHLTFRTDDKTIEPGKTVRLTKRPDYRDSRFIPDSITAAPQIVRVEYSDGTFWQRPNGSRD